MEQEMTVGAAAVAFETAGVTMLEGRPDLAVLWDIRVAPLARGNGVGGSLLEHAVGWARERGARQMKIETQNINVPACRFYAAHGFQLGLIHCYGYAGVPGCEKEVMLCWYRDLM
jgi:GNAT superfamily N-acetyltransferase